MLTIIGLGNPGLRYKWNRHNIGFHVIDLLAKTYKIKLRKNRYIPAFTGKGKIEGHDVVLMKPVTYMNKTGIAVKGFFKLYGDSPEEMLIVTDDINLPWNKLRIRKLGSSGGHNGLESIITEIGSSDFPRLRMGIGRPVNTKIDVVGHVLGNFNALEKKDLKDYCIKTNNVISVFLNKGIEEAMNKFN